MSRGNLERARRRRTRYSLQLLSISGAVRPADVEVCYRGADRLLGRWSLDTDWLGAEALPNHRSMWTTDLRELWHTDLREWWTTVSARIRATLQRAERSSWVKVALANIFPVTH
jgi:hypothetical protein